MKIETNEFITSIKREKKISITSSSKNKIENIAVQFRTSQKQQDKDVTIDTDAKETKKNVEQYSSHSKNKLKRERLMRMIEDEKTIMRTRNANKTIKFYVIFKLKTSSKYRNMTKKKKKQSVKKTLKNVNAKRFRDEVFDKLTKIFHRFFSQSNWWYQRNDLSTSSSQSIVTKRKHKKLLSRSKSRRISRRRRKNKK
jgi:hypothetical protein